MPGRVHGLLRGNVAGVEGGRGLEENDLDLVLGDGAVLDAAGYDEHLARGQLNLAVAKLHREGSAMDQEEFILTLVMVPIERALELDELDLLAVELGGDAR